MIDRIRSGAVQPYPGIPVSPGPVVVNPRSEITKYGGAVMRQLKLRWVIVMIAAVLGTLANAGLALGQATNSGTVVGEVTDASGAVIPGATVTLTDTGA